MQDEDLARFLANYRPPAGVADELMQGEGRLRPVWAEFIRRLAVEPPQALAQRFAAGNQYLGDAGVFFRQHTATGSTESGWPLSHIPVLISQEEWAGVSAGLVERADLLEQVMADLYGPANLVRDGKLPAELVAQNPEWLHQMVGLKPKSGHFLHHLAFEIGRSPDGSWFVLGDRTQAPSGAGFALENRMATTRMFSDFHPSANVERLAGFFRGFRDALNGLRENRDGRVAILTPGLHTDTYFEHAYIARYLGFMLLEGAELRTDGDRMSVQTTHGPVPVDVLWRRLDSRSTDPLEFDDASAIGTPGLAAALRAGQMTMVNALGSGVLESRAFMAFMPQIARHLLGKPLSIPNIATWWCGQPKERAYVRDNLERMLIGPAQSTRLPFDIDASTTLGGNLRENADQAVRAWIDRDGATLVGQEAVTLSTTPAMIDGTLAARPMVVRVFAARTPNGWTIMPGGYARIGRTSDPTALGMQSGGSVADVWIVSDKPVAPDTLTGDLDDGTFSRRLPALLPARAADNLFWLGRYAERAETVVRLLRAYHLRQSEYGGDKLLISEALESYLESFGVDTGEPVPVALMQLFDAACGCAGMVRDRFSPDGWMALTDLSKTAHDMASQVTAGNDAARAMSDLLRKIAGFHGLVHENMFRFDGWRFLTLGAAIERSGQMARLLSVFGEKTGPVGGYDLAVEVGDSVMTHRRRYSVATNRNTVIDLLALDGDNPRSLLFQVDRIKQAEERLSRGQVNRPLGDAARKILALRTALAVARPSNLTAARLDEIHQELIEISNAVSQQYFG
ncbi:circularly permuted type 2 ATP-grasp protein [Celeribacter arenosi]|uniref:Circularly permuted type 2 ATP-grasp protein n=1 Tax=Celeribacter arenosi TaxID=792649 RepID=A0ABP7KDT0_9RHOB